MGYLFKSFINWMRQKGRMKSLLSSVNKLGIKSHLIKADDMRYAMHMSKPVDVILTRAFAEITTVLQGSKFTHAAIKSDVDNQIIHAIGSKGVHKTDILDLFIGTERICIKRVRTTDAGRSDILDLANNYADENTPYDFNMVAEDKSSMYCSEFIYWCINPIISRLQFKDRYGFETYIPDDIFEDNVNFETMYDSGEIVHG